jgi:hypothetical protein
MRKLTILTFAAALTLSSAALAQDRTVSVDLSGISDDLAEQLGLDVDDLPDSILVSAETAAEACGVELESIGESCLATTATDDLESAITEEISAGSNSAKEFAPGQQDGDAKDFAPGQQDGDAKDFAPGQQKKDDGDSSGEQDGSGKDSAPGQNK